MRNIVSLIILALSFCTVAFAQQEVELTFQEQLAIAVQDANKQCPMALSKDITLREVFLQDSLIMVSFKFSKEQRNVLSGEVSKLKETAIDMTLADENMGSFICQLAAFGYKFRVILLCDGIRKALNFSPEELLTARNNRSARVTEKNFNLAVEHAKTSLPIDLSESMTLSGLTLTQAQLSMTLLVTCDVAGTEDIFAEQSLSPNEPVSAVHDLCQKDDALRMLISYSHSTNRSARLVFKERRTKRSFIVTL